MRWRSADQPVIGKIMRIYYFVNEVATLDDIRIAASLRIGGTSVTMCNARLCNDISQIRGADKVIYNNVDEKYIDIIENFCAQLNVVCEPAIPIVPPSNLQLQFNSTAVRRKREIK